MKERLEGRGDEGFVAGQNSARQFYFIYLLLLSTILFSVLFGRMQDALRQTAKRLLTVKASTGNTLRHDSEVES
jgi:hypothetical protein